jgi:hypothetical protein
VSASRPQFLLATLMALLAARGLSPETLDPWRGWLSFKQFAREVAEVPDHGVSVQIAPVGRSDAVRMYFLQQVLSPEGNRLKPTGGVVCEFTFPARGTRTDEWEAWSFDSSTFERFVDLVEQHPAFARLMNERPVATSVYWEDA